MPNADMMNQIASKAGFIAALDQSGGSTPGALRLYGIPETAYSGDAEMFKLVHAMRERIITAPAFTGDKNSRGHPVRTHDGRTGAWQTRPSLPVGRPPDRSFSKGRQRPRS